jgi:hypothetical protein
MMESHGNELNGIVTNKNELGMVISMIKSRTSASIKVTKGLGLDVYGSMILYILRIHIDYYCSPEHRGNHWSERRLDHV